MDVINVNISAGRVAAFVIEVLSHKLYEFNSPMAKVLHVVGTEFLHELAEHVIDEHCVIEKIQDWWNGNPNALSIPTLSDVSDVVMDVVTDPRELTTMATSIIAHGLVDLVGDSIGLSVFDEVFVTMVAGEMAGNYIYDNAGGVASQVKSYWNGSEVQQEEQQVGANKELTIDPLPLHEAATDVGQSII